MFFVTIKTDNAAFEHREAELSRILRDIADKLDRLDGRNDRTVAKIADINGNTVGTWELDTP